MGACLLSAGMVFLCYLHEHSFSFFLAVSRLKKKKKKIFHLYANYPMDIQYLNGKAAYVDNIWSVINWKTAEERYLGGSVDAFKVLKSSI